jgi:tRNA (cytidine56-2'-O)-methyltransferase
MLSVLRLGHRVGRDLRVTTHVALAARALGADAVILSGERDAGVLESVASVCRRWGGAFKISYEKDWRKFIGKFKGTKVHLTMYGLPLKKVICGLRRAENVLLIVGAEKVPREVYDAADYNVSVTSQPHSEVAALAVFLHEYFKGRELDRDFTGKTSGLLKIIPRERGKNVVKTA